MPPWMSAFFCYEPVLAAELGPLGLLLIEGDRAFGNKQRPGVAGRAPSARGVCVEPLLLPERQH
eukprot:7893734-Pyramimonas_sp.AAC.1